MKLFDNGETRDVQKAIGDIAALRIYSCLLPVLDSLNRLDYLLSCITDDNHQRGRSQQEEKPCETRDSS